VSGEQDVNLRINSPTENAENQVEHEKRPDNDDGNKVKPVESTTHSVVGLQTGKSIGPTALGLSVTFAKARLRFARVFYNCKHDISFCE